MHYTTVVATTLLASAAASAIPGTSPITVDKLTKRAEKVWDDKGNVKLTCKFLTPITSDDGP